MDHTFRTLIFILFLLTLGILKAQEFVTKIYLTSETGYSDSLEIGYDPSATIDLDQSFGESAVSEISDSFYLGQVNFTDYTCSPDNLSGTFQQIEDVARQITKKEIIPKTCTSFLENSGLEGFLPAITLFLPNKRLPIAVSWDAGVFNSECLAQSFVSDWNIARMWDIPCGNESLNQFNVADDDSLLIESPSGDQMVNGNDTFSIFYIILADELFSKAEESPISDIIPYPNPSDGYVNFDFNLSKNVFIEVFTSQGKLCTSFKHHSTGLYFTQSGIYFIRLKKKDRIKTHKIIITH